MSKKRFLSIKALSIFGIIFVFNLFLSSKPALALVTAEQTQNYSTPFYVWQMIQELGDNLSGIAQNFTFRVSTSRTNLNQFDNTAVNSKIYDKTTNTAAVPFGCLPSGSNPSDPLRGLTFSTNGVPAGYEDVTIDFSCHNYTFVPGHRYLIFITNANFGNGQILFAASAYVNTILDYFPGGGLRYANGNPWDYYHNSGYCNPASYIWGDITPNPISGCNIWTTTKDDLYFILNNTTPEPTPTPTPTPSPTPTPTPLPSKTPIIIVPGISASLNFGILSDRGDSGWSWMYTADSSWRQFIDSLEKAGYQKDKNYFIAFYDWRKTNDWTDPDPGAALPAKKYITEAIDKAKTANPGISKVNVIAHSMGGLVVRSYVESLNYRGDINKAFLIGSPNSGSTFAYYTWEGGEVPPNWDPVSKSALGVIIKLLSINFNEEPYQMIHNHLKGIKDLLPVGYDYVFKNGSLFNWVNMQEINNFLKNTSNSQNTVGIFANKGVSLTNITGIGQITGEKLLAQDFNHPYFWKDGKPMGNSSTADGDNTVLTSSSNLPGAEQLTVIGKHANLPNASTSQIFNKLGITYIPSSLAGAPNEVLVAWVASPVTLSVKDSLGNSVGELLTDPETDRKWVFVENPGSDYKINLTGTGNGQYHVGVDYYTDTKTESSQIQGTAITGANLNYDLHLDSQNTQPVNLQPEDKVPPVTNSQIQGTLGNNNWYISDVNISLSAIDNTGGSGVDKTEYSFDNTNWQTYTTPLIINNEKITPIYYRSYDLVGNIEPVQQANIKIDRTAPEVKVFFNIQNQNLEITEIDDLSSVQAVESKNTETLTDEAGNTTKLRFNTGENNDEREGEKEKENGKKKRNLLNLKDISYNNNPAIRFPENEFKINFDQDKKNNNIKEFKQELDIEKQIELKTNYNLKKNITTIEIEKPKDKKIREEKSGVILLKLLTNKGQLETIY